MKKTISLLILVLLIFGFIFIVSRSRKENSNSGLQVSASFYPMYFFASQIGGDKINVVNITPAGAEPHDYDLTPLDIIKIQQSKLLILNGAVEPWADKIKFNLKERDTRILVAGENLESQKIEENGNVGIDPHIWLSTALAKIESEKIAEELENIDPINANYYKSNLLNLESELNQIDENYKNGLKNCEINSFVTTHAAFGYLSKDYGLNQIAIDGLSPDAEPSLSQLTKISDFVK